MNNNDKQIIKSTLHDLIEMTCANTIMLEQSNSNDKNKIERIENTKNVLLKNIESLFES